MPHALFLQASEEALDNPVLLQCGGRNEPLAQADRTEQKVIFSSRRGQSSSEDTAYVNSKPLEVLVPRRRLPS